MQNKSVEIFTILPVMKIVFLRTPLLPAKAESNTWIFMGFILWWPLWQGSLILHKYRKNSLKYQLLLKLIFFRLTNYTQIEIQRECEIYLDLIVTNLYT
jgi:hypothetical protein